MTNTEFIEKAKAIVEKKVKTFLKKEKRKDEFEVVVLWNTYLLKTKERKAMLKSTLHDDVFYCVTFDENFGVSKAKVEVFNRVSFTTVKF